MSEIIGLDHVQLAMPPGQEDVARAFYGGVLGLIEEPKPANLASRGGVWFRGGALRLHLGGELDFRAARKAHPALLVRGLTALAARCLAAGYAPVTDEPLEGFERFYVFDPFGNRIELLEPRHLHALQSLARRRAEMDLLDRLLEHDAWTTRQLLERCRALSAEQLDRPFDVGHRTVRATFQHIIFNMEAWSASMAGATELPFRPPREGESIANLAERLSHAAAALEQVAHAVRARNGWDERWLDVLDIPPTEKTYGGAIAHLITHSMHHRAQVLYMLRHLGLNELPEGDVLSWEQQRDRA